MNVVDVNGKDLAPKQQPEYDEFPIPRIEIVGPRLLVMPKPKRTYQTAGGVIIPEHAQENAQEAVVCLIGDGVMLDNGERLEPRVQPGQFIIYARYAGIEIQIENWSYMIIQESDIRAVLTYKGTMFDASELHRQDDEESVLDS